MPNLYPEVGGLESPGDGYTPGKRPSLQKPGPSRQSSQVQQQIQKSSSRNSAVDAPKYTDEPGPKENRQCKDIMALFFFLLMWVGMFVIGGLAAKEGNLSRLKYGNDTEGNLCGVDNTAAGGRDLSSKPYQYIFNPLTTTTYKKCVAECPQTFGDVLCAYDTAVPSYNVSGSLDYTEWKQFYDDYDGNCTLTVKTELLLNRCVPDVTEIMKELSVESSSFQYSSGQELATQIFSDIYDSWKVILICSALSLVISFIWLYLMQWFAPVLVWVTVIFVNIIGLGATTYMWWNYYNIFQGRTADERLTKLIPTNQYNEEVILGVAVVLSIIVGFTFILSVSLRKRISLAIGLIQETSKAIRTMPMLIFFPIFKYIALALLTAWVIYSWAMLVTSGTRITGKVISTTEEYTGAQFQPNTVFQFLTIYVAFGYFWTFNWILAIAQTTIAGSIAIWYWTRDKTRLAASPVLTSFKRVVRYHLGSLAFGSLIVGTIQTIRAVLMYLQTTLNKRKDSKIVQNILACMQCCFACFEKFIKFLNKNAYIEIAVYGYSFIKASKTAFQLLVRNAVRVVVVDRVGSFVFFLGKLMIMMTSCLIGAYMLQPSNPSEAAKMWAVPLIIIAILSYIVASCFMAVIDMAIDTMFLCFCEDSERNDGGAKPYYMSESLRQFVDQSTKATPKV